MNVFGYHLSTNVTACSDWTISQSENPIEHIKLLCKHPGQLNTFWHLDYSVALILKYLNVNHEQATALWKSGELYLQDYIIKYIPSKFFSIRNGTHFGSPLSMFSNMSLYYECKFKKNETVADCLNRAQLAEEYGNKCLNVSRKLGIEPTTLTSPIRIFEKVYLGKYDEKGNPKPKGVYIPTTDDYPEEIRQQLADASYQCIHGGWVESFVQGYYPDAVDYDITSAYSYFASNLYDLRDGVFMRSKNYLKHATYGRILCNLKMTAPFHPVLYSTGGEGQYTPTGIYPQPTWRTKQELDIIDQYRLGSYEILDGFWWTHKRPSKPLYYLIKWLLKLKDEWTGFDKDFVKFILNSIWGKLLQVKKGDVLGDYFNPLYGSEVETNARMEVFRFGMKAQSEGAKILHIAVDGTITDKPVSFVDTGRAPGMWRTEIKSPALVISSGCVAIKDRRGKGDFGMDFEWITDQINKNPNKRQYVQKKISATTLGKCIDYSGCVNSKKYDMIGNIINEHLTVEIDNEIKRRFINRPVNGGELIYGQYDSYPVDTATLAVIATR